MGLRVPTYSGATVHQLKASWEWIEQAGRFLATHAGVIVGDLNTSTGRARFQPLLDGGWMRVQPEAGPSWFGTGGKSSEIDHVLHTGTCRVDSARFVRRAGGFDLVGSSDALSDHAALCFSASTTDSASVVRDRS